MGFQQFIPGLFLAASLCAALAKEDSSATAEVCATASAPALSYARRNGDISCARANAAAQERAFPDWHYDLATDRRNRVSARSSARDPLAAAWDPILERVPGGCTGLPDGWLREFRFTAVLDRSWVRFYRKHKKHFAAQGYRSLASSVRLSVDRVDYLFREQFGISVRLSQVVVLEDLDDRCETDDGFADRRDLTLRALRKNKTDKKSADGAVLRFGARSKDCKSYMRAGSELCGRKALVVMMQEPFLSDGRVRYAAPRALAHELAHLLGVCFDERRGHCAHSHTVDELPDIMVARPWAYGEELTHGRMYKFLTTCSPVYRDLLCARARLASCGRDVAPPSLAGRYAAAGADGLTSRSRRVRVTEVVEGQTYLWKSGEGASWTLTRRHENSDMLDVGASCPFRRYGYVVVTVRKQYVRGKLAITGITGPSDQFYEKESGN